jgi:hypothetical protein
MSPKDDIFLKIPMYLNLSMKQVDIILRRYTDRIIDIVFQQCLEEEFNL